MTTVLQQQITDLRAQIDAQEKEIQALESACITLERELADFEARYNAIVKPVADRLDAARAALEKLRDLQLMQQLGDRTSLESLWRDQTRTDEPYVPPHVRQFAIPEPIEIPIPEAQTPKNIKTLYRKLARQFHPDLADDEADRQRRTKLMSLINEAYQADDFESLQALNEHTTDQNDNPDKPSVNSQLSLDKLTLRKLQHRYQDLAIELRDLKERHHNLRYGSMMELKLQASLAKSNGEDLLTELASDMEADYWQIMQEIDALRQEVD